MAQGRCQVSGLLSGRTSAKPMSFDATRLNSPGRGSVGGRLVPKAHHSRLDLLCRQARVDPNPNLGA